jgi:protoporphyrin/coproporphyrin ferrochelatase
MTYPPQTNPKRKGVLLVNLGTPDSTQVRDVRRYLGQFLMDHRVIDIPWPLRALLVHGIILRTRPSRSAKAYKKVWTERGSPLLFHTQDLQQGLQKELGEDVRVRIAMRYQNPSVQAAFEAFAKEGVDDICAVPLFPQYSQAAWASAYDEVVRVAGNMRCTPNVRFIPAFYDHPSFLDSVAAVARPHLESFGADKVLMSFHGLPEKHVKKSDLSYGKHCLAVSECCQTLTEANRFCYSAQCFKTAQELATRLELEKGDYEVTFQSRLTKAWIKPFTDKRIKELPGEGVKRVAVLCPSFVADCLETIEEIGIQARQSFMEAGGEDLCAVPCINSDPTWVQAMAQITREPLLPSPSETAGCVPS